MECIREILLYKNYFNDFYKGLSLEVAKKVDYVMKLVLTEEILPAKFFKHIINVKGLYEIRIEKQSNIYRIFCCLDEGRVVVLFNGFQKKTQKTPHEQIMKAQRIMNEYFNEKKGKRS